MPSYIRSNIKFCQEHANLDQEKWKCKISGVEMLSVVTGRSIHYDGMHGAGGGEVRQVHHIYCPSCYQVPNITYGTPITEGELVEI